VINALDAHLASVALVEQMTAAFGDFGYANRAHTEQSFRGGEIDAGFLFFRLNLQEDDIFRSRIGQDGASQELDVCFIVDPAKGGGTVARNNGIRFANAAEKQQLKAEQAGECLQLDQARDQPFSLGANGEIDHDEVGM